MMLMIQSWARGEATEPDSAGMSKSDILRGIITEKLSTAAREILAVVQRTVADCEEEAAGFRREIDRQRRLLELLQPEVKLEADDQQLFSFCEAGGGQLPEDQEQHKYEPRLEDGGNMGFQAPVEEDEYQYLEQEEEHTTELEYAMASRLFLQTDQSKRRRRKGRRQSSKPQNRTHLRIRILENSKIEVLSKTVFYKYPLHKLKVPHGLQEADFLDLLRSTFPQLADEPFDLFLCGKHRKLKPLKVNSLTPEEIDRVSGNSALYIRLQREDADEDLPSTPDTIRQNTRVTADETTPTSLSLTETDTHINLKICILEDPQMDIISPIVFQNYPPHELQVPHGLQEADFLALLRSTFPQLAAGEPFTILTDHAKKLKPLRVESVTPEEIYRTKKSPGNPVIFIRLKGPEKRSPQREVAAVAAEDPPFTLDPTTPNTEIKSDRPQISQSDTHIHLKVRIVEDPQMDMISPNLFQNYPPHELQVPRGLQEADFLALLRSTFPQLAAGEPFTILSDHARKLKPLRVESVTPEEIYRTRRSTGNPVIYIRLKGPVKRSPQREVAVEDPPPTTPNTEIKSDRPQISQSDTHIHLKVRIVEDPQMNIISPNLFQNYPPHELQVPRGLQEADFLALLRSTFPQLAAGEPFTILTDHARKLKPLRVESVTPEEIYRTSRSTGNPVIYIRLKGPVKRSTQREVAAEDPPPAPDPTTLNTEVQSDMIPPVRQLLSTSDTHVDLKICILEDSNINMISPTTCQTYPLQCPHGLQEADFLNLLRSTFPELTAAEPLELLKSNEDGILEPLNVESLTAEEIKRAVGSAGSVTLFVRLKAPKDAQASVKNLDGAKDSPSFSKQIRPHTSEEPNGLLKTEAGFLNQLFQITDAIKPLDEDLRGIILRALPVISEDTQQALIDKLLSNGLESTQDLKYVTKEDIADLLPAFQLRKLLEAFKNETELVTLDLQTIPYPSSLLGSPATLPCSTPSSVLPLSNQESSSSENCGQASLFRKQWPETLQVPWNLMPMEVRAAVAEGKRPSPAARRQMVRILVDEMRRHELNPSRSQCVIICRKVIHSYPQSFADLCDNGQLLGEGYTSLLIQIKNRIDNLNRTRNFRNRHSSGLKRGSAYYTYGCTRFEPSLPPEETDETVERKRQRLEEIYCQDGANVAEKDEVTELMKITFCLQRRQINALPAPAIRDLRGQWPYLFTQNGLYTHFQLLTDIKVLCTLGVAMEECGQTILELFSKSTNPDVQAILSLGPNLELSFCVIQLLMAHFTEALEGLILFANASATAADIEKTLQLPATPRLILLVESPGSSIYRWMISLEGNIICEGIQPTFLSGLAAVFSTYYIFNLQYQDDAACTLEFIQRRFIGINPDRGTKAPRGKFLSKQTGKFAKKKTTPINPRVLTLLNKLMDVNLAVYTHTAMFPSVQRTSD